MKRRRFTRAEREQRAEIVSILRMFVYTQRKVSDRWIMGRSLFDALWQMFDSAVAAQQREGTK